LDANPFVVVDKVIEKKCLSDVADGNAVSGRSGDVAASDGRATIERGIAVAIEDDGVPPCIANGDGINIDFGGGLGIDSGKICEISFQDSTSDGNFALAGDGDQAGCCCSRKRCDGAVENEGGLGWQDKWSGTNPIVSGQRENNRGVGISRSGSVQLLLYGCERDGVELKLYGGFGRIEDVACGRWNIEAGMTRSVCQHKDRGKHQAREDAEPIDSFVC